MIPNDLHHAKRISGRARAKAHENGEDTEICAVMEAKKTMFDLHWRLIGDTREADNIGVDQVYRKDFAEIDIQAKGSTIHGRQQRLIWGGFNKKDGINMDFYGQFSCFLFLAGFDKTSKIINKALIPARKVPEYFRNHPEAKDLRISLSMLKDHEFYDYFGESNIQKTLANESKLQQEEHELLKQLRLQKEHNNVHP